MDGLGFLSIEDRSTFKVEDYERHLKRYLTGTPWKNHVDAKVDLASPYNFFLTRVAESRESYEEDLTISFPELLDSSLGELQHSLHITYVVQLDWLVAQYKIAGHRRPSMTILYNHMDRSTVFDPEINTVKVQSPYMSGHHHTKMSIFFYKDMSLRVCIFTANLIELDWENRTQAVWVSPLCTYLGDNVPYNYGESDTLFKHDILNYLKRYSVRALKPSLRRIQKANFSEIKVFLITSVPGDAGFEHVGCKKVRTLLHGHVPRAFAHWDLVIQCSSIGMLGDSPEAWFNEEFLRHFNCQESRKQLCNVKLVYPTMNNVERSYDGRDRTICGIRRISLHQKQHWTRKYLVQWMSDHRNRTRAVPYSETYGQISPEGDKLSWFLMSSASLSKSAWGMKNKKGKTQAYSYEVGVLFLPRVMIGKDYFTIKNGGNVDNDIEAFPVPYDIPFIPYGDEDLMHFCEEDF